MSGRKLLDPTTYICMYVCIYVCMYVCMYICLSIRQSIHLSVYLKCTVEARSAFHESPSPAGSLATVSLLSSPQPSHLAAPSSGTFANVMLHLCEVEFRRKCQVLTCVSSGCRTIRAASHYPRCYRRYRVLSVGGDEEWEKLYRSPQVTG